MQYLIIDWMSYVCFNSQDIYLTDIEEASEFLDRSLLDESPNLEACENQECACKALDHECSSLEDERQEYSIEEYNEDIDRIIWTGTRYRLVKNYYN